MQDVSSLFTWRVFICIGNYTFTPKLFLINHRSRKITCVWALSRQLTVGESLRGHPKMFSSVGLHNTCSCGFFLLSICFYFLENGFSWIIYQPNKNFYAAHVLKMSDGLCFCWWTMISDRPLLCLCCQACRLWTFCSIPVCIYWQGRGGIENKQNCIAEQWESRRSRYNVWGRDAFPQGCQGFICSPSRCSALPDDFMALK